MRSQKNSAIYAFWAVAIAVCLLLVVFALFFSSCSRANPTPVGTAIPTKTPASPAITAPAQTREPGADNTDEPGAPVTDAPAGALLGETEDAGQEYVDKLVFLGDSTTYGLMFYGVLSGGKQTTQVWTPASGTLALFNYSIATIVYPETGEELLIADAAARKQPEYLVMTVGVNGVSSMDEDSFKRDYAALVDAILAASPNTKIICNSIYPVEASYEAKGNGINNEVINRANGWILQLAEEKGLRYCDSASVLKGADGKLVSAYGNGDGIHLSADGFNLVLNYLRTHAYK